MPLLAEQNFSARGSRKEKRKTARKLLKARKVAFATRKSIESVLNAAEGAKKVDKKKTKKRKKRSRKSDESADGTTGKRTKPDDGDDTLAPVVKSEADKLRRREMRELIKEDDLEMKRLAKKLGYNKRKSKNTPKVFEAEGLDYILDVCDPLKRKSLIDDSDFERSDISTNDSDSSSDDDTADGGLAPPVEHSTEQLGKKRPSVPVRSAMLSSNDDDDSETEINDNVKPNDAKRVRFATQSDNGDEEEESTPTINEKKEDIYGRVIATDPLAPQPSAAGARKKLAELEAKLSVEDGSAAGSALSSRLRLEKTMRGVINRLSEATLASSLRQVQTAFSQHARHDVKNVLTDELLKAVLTSFRLPVRLELEYATLLALIHTSVSSEITAHILETIAVKLNESVKCEHVLDDKSTENLTVLLAHLSNFKVVNASLVLEFMRLLLHNFNEFNVELLLACLTHCGFSLRKGDPAALKQFISDVQIKISSVQTEFENNVKIRFMFDTLTAIKNNNVLKLSPNFDFALLEHYLKIYRGLVKGSAKESPLLVGFNDLLDADKNGRWWVVGSAWTGNIAATITSSDVGTINPGLTLKADLMSKTSLGFEPELLRLAKKAKMSTDVRRNIFCILMSAELTTQYALWDRIRTLGEFKSSQRANLAMLAADLIRMESVGLSVLKIVEFGTLQSKLSKFLKTLFTKLFCDSTERKAGELFAKVVNSPKLRGFADGLQIFMHMVMRHEAPATLGDKQSDSSQNVVNSRVDFLDSVWGSDVRY